MEKDELQIIERAKSRDTQAFQQLVEAYSHKVYATSYRILGNKELAEDCVQETFLKIYTKLGSFSGQSKFSTWLYSIAVNTAIDFQRKYKKYDQNDSESFEQFVCQQTDGLEQSIWRDNIHAATQRALMQLNEELRHVFILRHHEERSIEEISQILEINPNTVKNRIFRAVGRIREILQPKIGEFTKGKSQ